MNKKIAFINAKSGRSKRGNELQKLLDALNEIEGVEPHILQKNEDPTALARKLAEEGAEAVGAAGGDGTVSSVASGLIGTNTALVTIPFGTLNHFARDLGIPSNCTESVRLFNKEEALERQIDVGKVNERFFLNNSSLGLYPHLVKLREQNEAKLGKWLAYLVAFQHTLRYPVYVPVRLSPEEEERPLKVWLVFASNNPVVLSLPKPGYREHLDQGLLDMYTLRASNPLALFRTAFYFAIGKLAQSSMVSEHKLQEFTVSSKRSTHISVACDGEVYRMKSPLNYRILPSALKVRVPLNSSKAKSST